MEIGSQSSSRSRSGGGGGHLHILMLARSIYIVGASRRPPAVPGPHSLHPSSSLQYAQWSSSSSVRLLFFFLFFSYFRPFLGGIGGAPLDHYQLSPLCSLHSSGFLAFLPLFSERQIAAEKKKERRKRRRRRRGGPQDVGVGVAIHPMDFYI